MHYRILFSAIVIAFACTALFADEPTPNSINLLVRPDKAGKLQPIKTTDQWQARRKQILDAFEEVAGPLPDRKNRIPLDVRVTEETPVAHAGGAYSRKKLSFASEPGDRVLGYLLVPEGAKRRPAILCLHQTNTHGSAETVGLAGPEYCHYAQELAERGYVTLSVDYPNFGEYKFDPYTHGYASATIKGIWNHMRAVDVLESLPEVDRERIGVIGHSLGGHNSIFVAVFDPRIKCVVSSCGFCRFARYYGGDLTGWSHNGYMPRIRERYDRNPRKMPFDFTELIAALAPRPFLAIAPLHDANFDVQGVRECIAAAEPVYELFDAPERLQALYPDAEHSFPKAEREAAYAWFERWLAKPAAE